MELLPKPGFRPLRYQRGAAQSSKILPRTGRGRSRPREQGKPGEIVAFDPLGDWRKAGDPGFEEQREGRDQANAIAPLPESIAKRLRPSSCSQPAAKAEAIEAFLRQHTEVRDPDVLDEGVDVPDAELGIIMSGTGSGRELIQRLGRILRPKQDGRKARLVELVSKHTRETNTSAKRITALKKNSEMDSSFSSQSSSYGN